jgi:kinesin family protein 5
MSNSIKVVARFRPQNRTEIELGGQPIVEFESEDTCRLDVGNAIGLYGKIY